MQKLLLINFFIIFVQSFNDALAQLAATQFHDYLLLKHNGHMYASWPHALRLLVRYKNEERQYIARVFKASYDKELRDVLENNMPFSDVALALFDIPEKYDARLIHDAINGPGTDEDVLIEIFATRSYNFVYKIRKEYEKMYGSEMFVNIKDDVDGPFGLFILSIAGYYRPRDFLNTPISWKDAQKQALSLFNGFEIDRCIQIFSDLNYNQLRLVFRAFERIANYSIETAMTKKFDGNLLSGFIQMIKFIRNPSKYFAEKLQNAMAGTGTDEDALIRIIVTRSEIELPQIMKDFQNEEWKMSLRDAIIDDVSTDFQTALLEMVDEFPYSWDIWKREENE